MSKLHVARRGLYRFPRTSRSERWSLPLAFAEGVLLRTRSKLDWLIVVVVCAGGLWALPVLAAGRLESSVATQEELIGQGALTVSLGLAPGIDGSACELAASGSIFTGRYVAVGRSIQVVQPSTGAPIATAIPVAGDLDIVARFGSLASVARAATSRGVLENTDASGGGRIRGAVPDGRGGVIRLDTPIVEFTEAILPELGSSILLRVPDHVVRDRCILEFLPASREVVTAHLAGFPLSEEPGAIRFLGDTDRVMEEIPFRVETEPMLVRRLGSVAILAVALLASVRRRRRDATLLLTLGVDRTRLAFSFAVFVTASLLPALPLAVLAGFARVADPAARSSFVLDVVGVALAGLAIAVFLSGALVLRLRLATDWKATE